MDCKWINEVSQSPCSCPVKRSSQTSNERQPLSAAVMEPLYTPNRAILDHDVHRMLLEMAQMNPEISGKSVSELKKKKKGFHVH